MSIRRLVPGVFAVAALAGSSTATAGIAVTYELGPGADFFSGCFDPCECLINWYGTPVGQFAVTLTDETPNSRTYSLESIDWVVKELGWQIVGNGTYVIDTAANTHRMTATLSVNGGGAEFFDSEDQPYDGSFPAIEIEIDVNNHVCIDTVIRVVAAPVPTPGDLDGDGCVGQADLGILLSCFNQTDCGDLDGDGQTGQSDLGILLAHFGEGCP